MIEGAHRFYADHHFEEIGRRMEESLAARQAEVEQLNQKKNQIQKSKEGLNNALKNIKTRFGKTRVGGRGRDSAGTPCTISSFFLLAPCSCVKTFSCENPSTDYFRQRPPEGRHHRR